MPLVRIDLRAGHTADYRQAISDGIHRSLVQTIGIPEDDRFHIVTSHPAEELIYDREFAGVHRSDDLVIVQITLRRGRDAAARLRLHRAITDALAERPGVRPEDVMIVLTENDPVDWSVGNGEAQLLRTLPAILPPLAYAGSVGGG